jgi:hypothetical protein
MSLVSVLQMVFGTRTPFVPPSEATLPLGAEIREISPEDREPCLKIYRDNEPGRFPAGVGPDFEHFLSRSDYLKLVCCVADKPVAVGGIGIIPGPRSSRAWLVFGMVTPELHGQGIGTALLLARLAALRTPSRPVRILLSNVAGSVGFFARFGFKLEGQMAIRPGGQLIDVCSAMLDSDTWEMCRRLAINMGVNPQSFEVPQIDMDPRSPNNRPRGV